MTMDRDGQNIGTGIEDILGTVAVVKINVEDCRPSVKRELMGGNGGIIEVAKPAIDLSLGMVSRRAA
jgi:hypothetical protein